MDFVAGTELVNENAGPLRVRVKLNTPADFRLPDLVALGETLAISLSTVDGTATAGEDYTALSGAMAMLTFAPSDFTQSTGGCNCAEATKTVSVQVLDDAVYEPGPPETLSLTLSGMRLDYVGGASITRDLEIMDDDPDSTLSALAVNDGTNDLTLTPTFAVARQTYTASAPNSVETVIVTAMASESGASVTIAPTDSDTNTSGHQVALREGENTITVTVTNDRSTWTYTVTVTRAAGSNADPAFSDETATRSVAENTAADQNIGAPVSTTDTDTGDTLEYTLTGADADSFTIDSDTGQLKTKDPLDFETDPSYTVIVGVQDNKDSTGGTDSAVDDSIIVTITVSNEDEDGTVTLSSVSDPPRVGTALVASLTDPDGTPSNVTWQWSSAATAGGTFGDIASATSASYTPAAGDVGNFLKATASYDDPQGSGKTAEAVSASATQAALVTNAAPTATTGEVTTADDTDYTFAASDFNYMDGDSDALASVKIVTLPAIGMDTLEFDGTAITLSDLPKTVTATELGDNKLVYAPVSGGTGDDYFSFTFRVNDGTVDSASAYTMYIDVYARAAITALAVTSTPQLYRVVSIGDSPRDIYGAGETIRIAATFDSAVTVTGTPHLVFSLFGNNTNAEYGADNSTATALVFAYTVQSGDTDDNGIFLRPSVDFTVSGSGPIVLETGETITTDTGGFAADLDIDLARGGQRDDHKVDGTRSLPAPVSLSVTSTPLTDTDTYGRGETIRITLTMSAAVNVMGTPHLVFNAFGDDMIGGTRANAEYDAATSTATALVFAYTVQSGDSDTDGIVLLDGRATGLGDSAVVLETGEAITAVDGGHDADLVHPGSGLKADHKADGSRTPPGTNTEPAFSDETATRSVAENTATDQDIGGAPVDTTDDDTGDTLEYTLTGNDADSFAIDSDTGQLKTKDALDFETDASYTVTVGCRTTRTRPAAPTAWWTTPSQ